jgi:hypothetical protein
MCFSLQCSHSKELIVLRPVDMLACCHPGLWKIIATLFQALEDANQVVRDGCRQLFVKLVHREDWFGTSRKLLLSAHLRWGVPPQRALVELLV